ncbi:MAG: hypothetical protein Aurels2KO_29220 [Aureliella sp.]
MTAYDPYAYLYVTTSQQNLGSHGYPGYRAVAQPLTASSQEYDSTCNTPFRGRVAAILTLDPTLLITVTREGEI